MNYVITTKDKSKMRYPTAGDYYEIGGITYVDICKQSSEDKDFCIMIHELIEEHLTRKRGISEQLILDFDLLFEKERDELRHGPLDEPGYDLRAPYRKEHIFSENIERLLAQELDIDWTEYNDNLIS